MPTMDAQHEANLQRILEKRRAGGRLIGTQGSVRKVDTQSTATSAVPATATASTESASSPTQRALSDFERTLRPGGERGSAPRPASPSSSPIGRSSASPVGRTSLASPADRVSQPASPPLNHTGKQAAPGLQSSLSSASVQAADRRLADGSAPSLGRFHYQSAGDSAAGRSITPPRQGPSASPDRRPGSSSFSSGLQRPLPYSATAPYTPVGFRSTLTSNTGRRSSLLPAGGAVASSTAVTESRPLPGRRASPLLNIVTQSSRADADPRPTQHGAFADVQQGSAPVIRRRSPPSARGVAASQSGGLAPTPSAAGLEDLQRQVSGLQQQLNSGQTDQVDRLEELRHDIRAVQAALVESASIAATHSSSSARGPRSTGSRLVPAPRATLDAPMAVPLPIGPSSRAVTARTDPAPVNFTAGRRQPTGPPRPPMPARPYATSSVDVDSSIALLRRGDWFHKWDRSGKPSPAYVWLNAETYLLQWGKRPNSSSVFSNYVKIEEIHDVATSDYVDHHNGGARVLFILTVFTGQRSIRLGTEKREKLNTWYDCFRTVMGYYRSLRHRGVRHARSSD